MKNFKKLVSIMLALVMAAAMAILPAFAADGDTPDPAAAKAHTYQVYQIFKGEVTKENGKDVLANAVYGANINADAIEALADDEEATGVKSADVTDVAPGNPVAKSVMDYFSKIKDGKSEADLAVALYAFVKADSTPVATETASGTEAITVKNNDIVPGYYLIKDQAGTQTGTDANYTLYVVEVVDTKGEITFNPKVGVPKPDKKIVEDGEEKERNNAAIGDVVNYKITGTMPTNFDKYNKYYYQFVDTLSGGLTYNNDMVVKVGETVIDAKKYSISIEKPGVTIIKVTFDDVKTAIDGANKDTVITLTYSATLNERADIGNENDVKIVYSNDPNATGEGAYKEVTGETPIETVTTCTTLLTINKVDDDSKPLTGAEFTLTGKNLNKVVVKKAEAFVEAADGTYYKLKNGTYTETEPTEETTEQYEDTAVKYTKTKSSNVLVGKDEEETVVKGTVNEDGTITFYGLKAGTYTLSETKTPDGYNTIKDIEFTITFVDGEFAVESRKDETDGVPVKIVSNGQVLTTNIMNKKGSLLPSTGGIGTTIFYVVGSVVVAAAVVLLVIKSKKRASKAN